VSLGKGEDDSSEGGIDGDDNDERSFVGVGLKQAAGDVRRKEK
jgi:hypothetical protein